MAYWSCLVQNGGACRQRSATQEQPHPILWQLVRKITHHASQGTHLHHRDNLQKHVTLVTTIIFIISDVVATLMQHLSWFCYYTIHFFYHHHHHTHVFSSNYITLFMVFTMYWSWHMVVYPQTRWLHHYCSHYYIYWHYYHVHLSGRQQVRKKVYEATAHTTFATYHKLIIM